MAGIQTSIQIQDRMSATLNHVTQAMSVMLVTFEQAQTAASQGIDTASWELVRDQVAQASAAAVQFQEEMARAAAMPPPAPPVIAPPPAPPEPTWTAMAAPPVFVNSGADRFEAEFQAASNAAQELSRNQQAISAQARNMRVIPPGMINDVAATDNRIQGLVGRIQVLNNIPVDLRTDQTNNDLERMRGSLTQLVGIQGRLSTAMGQMDISAINAEYQQLNRAMDSVERGVRDNLGAQEQFNQSIRSGNTAASGLGSSIKRYAAMLISVATAGKAISLADEVSQTTSRINLMTGSLEETELVQQKVYASAQRTGTSYLATADVVAKLGQRAGDAFGGSGEIVQFAENLNKQFIIAGASQQEISSASLQLTQALGSGVLRGEELNAVFEAAPNVIQTIADYLGVPIGKIREMASDGEITAEIVKNAMLEATDEINAKFDGMPMTFGRVANSIQNQAVMAFQPALQQLSAITQTEGFNALVGSVTGAIQMMATGAVQALNMMGMAVLWVQENWSWLGPVIGGVMAAVLLYKGAVLAYTIIQGISNGLKALAAIASVAHGAAVTGEMVATTGLSAAQIGFNAALLACPLTWIVVAIIAVVVALAIWVNRIGGLKVAWLTCVNFVLTWVDKLKLGFSAAWMNIQNGIDSAQYGFVSFRFAVQDVLGDLKVKALLILEGLINGAIDRINQLIGFVNSIAGTSFELIEHVEMGASAAIEEEAKQKQRAAFLAELGDRNAADKKARQLGQDQGESDAARREAERQAGIAAAKAESEEKKKKDSTGEEADPFSSGGGGGGSGTEIAGNTGNTAANTAAMADSMDIIDEDLKYMRDAAEQEIINRFTLAELKVDVNNNNTLKTKTDFADVNRMLGDVTGEILAAGAAGGYI